MINRSTNYCNRDIKNFISCIFDFLWFMINRSPNYCLIDSIWFSFRIPFVCLPYSPSFRPQIVPLLDLRMSWRRSSWLNIIISNRIKEKMWSYKLLAPCKIFYSTWWKLHLSIHVHSHLSHKRIRSSHPNQCLLNPEWSVIVWCEITLYQPKIRPGTTQMPMQKKMYAYSISFPSQRRTFFMASPVLLDLILWIRGKQIWFDLFCL